MSPAVSSLVDIPLDTATPLDRADDVEIARRLVADIGRASEQPMTLSQGEIFWRPGGSAKWERVWERDLHVLVMRYAGVPIARSSRVLHVSAARVRSVVRLSMMLMPYDLELRRQWMGRGW